MDTPQDDSIQRATDFAKDKHLDLPVPPHGSKRMRVTERQQYKRCRRMWFYAFRQLLQPLTMVADARSLGRAVHEALKVYYNYDRDETRAWTAWAHHKVGLDFERTELGNALLTGYFQWAQIADDGFEVVAVEQPISALIPGTDVYLQGTIDLIVDTPRGRWIVDHKTYRDFLKPEQVEFDDQMTAYLWMARENKLGVQGAIYSMLRKKVPNVPEPLKSGKGLSKAMNIDTTAAIYRKAIKDHGYDERDYQDILRFLDTKGNTFFKREPVRRTGRQLNHFGELLKHEADEIFSPNTVMYPHFHRECHYCDFTSLCRSQNDQGDVESVVKSLFIKVDDPNKIKVPNI